MGGRRARVDKSIDEIFSHPQTILYVEEDNLTTY